MRVAILIHAHRDPDLLARLASRLQHPSVDIYINVDAKIEIDPFVKAVPNATFICNRVDVIWGRFSQVQQILNSFQEIAETEINYSHVLFISGQDYPIKDIDQIIHQLTINADKSFLDFHALGTDNWSELMRQRYYYWHFLPKGDLRSNKWVEKILKKIGFKRKYPLTPVYYGSCWMCLNMKAIKYILAYIKKKPLFVKFHLYSGCSDEFFFQNILVHSPLKETLINQIYRFIDWSDNGKRPKDLTMDDLDKIKQSDAWFVRKINPEIDAELPNVLDQLAKKG